MRELPAFSWCEFPQPQAQLEALRPSPLCSDRLLALLSVPHWTKGAGSSPLIRRSLRRRNRTCAKPGPVTSTRSWGEGGVIGWNAGSLGTGDVDLLLSIAALWGSGPASASSPCLAQGACVELSTKQEPIGSLWVHRI